MRSLSAQPPLIPRYKFSPTLLPSAAVGRRGTGSPSSPGRAARFLPPSSEACVPQRKRAAVRGRRLNELRKARGLRSGGRRGRRRLQEKRHRQHAPRDSHASCDAGSNTMAPSIQRGWRITARARPVTTGFPWRRAGGATVPGEVLRSERGTSTRNCGSRVKQALQGAGLHGDLFAPHIFFRGEPGRLCGQVELCGLAFQLP